MHVVLNAQLLSDQAGYRSAGMSNYTPQPARRAQPRLGDRRGGSPRSTPAGFDVAGIAHVTPRLLERPAMRIAWEQIVLPQLLRQLGADLVHGLVNVLPLATSVPGVSRSTTSAFCISAISSPRPSGSTSARCAGQAMRKAAAVIAVSRQTAGDVVRCFSAA